MSVYLLGAASWMGRAADDAADQSSAPPPYAQVLQQAPKQAVVWGRCAPADCASVKVSVATEAGLQLATVSAGPGGEVGTFIAKLPPTVGGDTPHTVTATAGSATATLTDVLFGDGACRPLYRPRRWTCGPRPSAAPGRSPPRPDPQHAPCCPRSLGL
jgi:hypothetical protein